MIVGTILVGAIVFLLVYSYQKLTRKRGYLETLGIPVIKPGFILGSPPNLRQNVKMHLLYQENFKKFNCKTYGLYEGSRPTIITIDPKIIKSIVVENFESFLDAIDIPLQENQMTMDISKGPTWRALRKNLSPVFSSGKLKGMLKPMAVVADDMMDYLDEIQKENSVIDVKPLFQGYAMDTIAQCAFGIKADAYRNPNAPLLKYGRDIFQAVTIKNLFEDVMFQLFLYFPSLTQYLPLFPPAWEQFWGVTNDIIKSRQAQNIKGNDFIAMLLDLLEERRANPNAEYMKDLTDDIIIAQGIVFFSAGYETTANTLSTLSYTLANHPDIQEKIFEEVTEALERHKGKIDHETINDMTYLDACLNENLRLNAPVMQHFRVCNKDCEVIPGLTIKEGTTIYMPMYASHYDPDFFPDPEEFRPERFFKENVGDIIPYTFRPFGGGLRLCIGQRFSLIEMKIAMAKIIAKYRICSTPETKMEIMSGDSFFLVFPEMKLKLELR